MVEEVAVLEPLGGALQTLVSFFLLELVVLTLGDKAFFLLDEVETMLHGVDVVLLLYLILLLDSLTHFHIMRLEDLLRRFL